MNFLIFFLWPHISLFAEILSYFSVFSSSLSSIFSPMRFSPISSLMRFSPIPSLMRFSLISSSMRFSYSISSLMMFSPISSSMKFSHIISPWMIVSPISSLMGFSPIPPPDVAQLQEQRRGEENVTTPWRQIQREPGRQAQQLHFQVCQ